MERSANFTAVRIVGVHVFIAVRSKAGAGEFCHCVQLKVLVSDLQRCSGTATIYVHM